MKLWLPGLVGMALLFAAQDGCEKDNDGDGWTVNDGDCDDDNSDVFPGAEEFCDEVDTDCDGELDPVSCTANVVFISSEGFDGNFGGVEGADAACQTAADAAGLTGTFMAWVSGSTSSSSPSERFNQSTLPYVLVDGTIIADNWDDLIDGTLQAGIKLDEYGQASTYSLVYTFTLTDGTPGLFGSASSTCYGDDCHCNDWTNSESSGSPTPGSAVARVGYSTSEWTDYSFGNFCAGSFPIYCFQQ